MNILAVTGHKPTMIAEAARIQRGCRIATILFDLIIGINKNGLFLCVVFNKFNFFRCQAIELINQCINVLVKCSATVIGNNRGRGQSLKLPDVVWLQAFVQPVLLLLGIYCYQAILISPEEA